MDTMCSTSSKLEGILDNQLSFTNIMVAIWPFDEKSIGTYYTKIFDAVIFIRASITLIFFSNKTEKI